MKHNNIKSIKKIKQEKYNVYKYEYENGEARTLTVTFKDSDKKQVVETSISENTDYLSYEFEDGKCVNKYYSTKSKISDSDMRETIYYNKDGTKAIVHDYDSRKLNDKNHTYTVNYYNKDNVLIKTKIQTEVALFGKKYVNKTIIDYKDGTVKTDKITEPFDEWNEAVDLIYKILNDHETIKEAFLKLDYRSSNLFLDVLDKFIPTAEIKYAYKAKSYLLYSIHYNVYELKELFLEVLKKIKPDYKDDKLGNRYYPNNLNENINLYDKNIIGKVQYYTSLIENKYGISQIEEYAKSDKLLDVIKSEYKDLPDEDVTDIYTKLLECILVDKKKKDDLYIRSCHSYTTLSSFENDIIKKVFNIDLSKHR